MRITMQYKMFLIKYAEIGTKGKNRYVFEEIMCKRMRARLKPLGKFEVRREYGRIFVEAFSDYDYEDVMKVLTTIFGIVGVCPVKVVEELSRMYSSTWKCEMSPIFIPRSFRDRADFRSARTVRV